MSRNYLDSAQDHLVTPNINQPPPPYYGAQNDPYDLTPTPHAVNRPRLPDFRRNPLLRDLPEDVNVVKFQTIVREETEIVVGRVKVPTPGPTAHAFILRRYDTNSVSLTTMFKVAFPGATDEEEKTEMDWVRASFDTHGCNGGRDSAAVKLAGQWIPRQLAIHLAPAYGLTDLIAALSRASPDPNVVYRKSQRSQAAADEMARTRLSVPSMEESSTPAPKRIRRQSPPTVPADNRVVTVEATTTVTAPAGAEVDVDDEIEQAKQLVLTLKRELRLKAAAGETLEDQGFAVGESSRGVKRSSDGDDGVSLSGVAGGKRVIAKSKRVDAVAGQSTASRVAWSAMLFGLGAAATVLIPQFASNFL